MIASLARLFVRLLATKARLVLLGLLASGMVLLALVLRGNDDPISATWRLFSLYALGGLVPVASLVIASSAYGDLIEDRTLVHLWLRPVSRAALLTGAWLASIAVVVPFTVAVPAVALAVAGMPFNVVVTASLSALLGTAAYTAVFTTLGLKVRRALAWGLAYILIWEGAVANAGAGLAKLALRLSTRSIAHRAFDGAEIRYPLATWTSIVVLVCVTVGALGLGLRWLRRAEVA
jgi:ABC-2 type transport system permease protein